jgi:uncharacterized membrane protein YbhN (UPF0104 family)
VKRSLLLAAKLAVTLALLAWLGGRSDLAALGRAFAGAQPAWVVAAALLAGLAYPAMAARLHSLLRLQQLDTPFAAAHRLVWVGQFFNAFLPGGAGGDLARAYYLVRDHPGRRAAALCALLADRFLGLTLLALLAAGAAFWIQTGPAEPPAGLSLVYLLPLAMTGAWVCVWTLPQWSAWPERWAPFREAAQRLVSRPRGLGLGAAWSAAIWAVDVAAALALAAALHLPLSWGGTALALALGYAAALLPISFGGHGVREGTVVATVWWLLAHEGAEAPAAAPVAFALGLLALQLGWSAVGAVVFVCTRRRAPIPRPSYGS